jgi:hypothetical protein
MSKILAALAIATVTASPAFAQAYDPSVGSGNIVSSPYRTSPTVPNGTAHQAYARSPHSVQPRRSHITARPERKTY